MFMAKAKLVAAVVLTVAVLGGGGAITYRTRAAGLAGVQPKPKSQEQDAKAVDQVAALKAQLKENRKALDDAAIQLAKRAAQLLDKNQELADTKAKLASTAEQLSLMQKRAVQYEALLKEAHKKLEDQAVTLHRSKTQTGQQDSDRAALLEKTRDEVELLEAQLAVKRVHVEMARASVEAATERIKAVAAEQGALPRTTRLKLEEELTSAKAQVRLKQAELMEPEVRLAQAKRRLAKLEGPKKKVTNPANQEQRLKELEQKLDVLLKEMTILRQELKTRQRGNP
jgi:hypothetical protein